MKALLWVLLVAAVAVNASTSFAFDGGKQIAISVGTGIIALASAAALFLLRPKRAKA
ncbi:hypothetical protein ACFW9F_24840 [Streptomyces sp. NPDC059506]|uniref:hypothetical protein n=1 Tax=Streptomyces TaxID=1883 RepID=UPI0015FB47A7|nr:MULTISPECIES: hypothetical protein [unclassified Streptomyces]MCZ2525339.1 hypothetical protein [Streptomyces sp. HB2AG]